MGMADLGKCQIMGNNLESDTETYPTRKPQLKRNSEDFNLDKICAKSDSIFIAIYNPKASPPIKIKEYLKGKGSSASALALMEARAQIATMSPGEMVVFAAYRKGDYDAARPAISLNGNIKVFTIINNIVMQAHENNISVDELKSKMHQIP